MRQVNRTKKLAALLLSFSVMAAPLGLLLAEDSSNNPPSDSSVQIEEQEVLETEEEDLQTPEEEAPLPEETETQETSEEEPTEAPTEDPEDDEVLEEETVEDPEEEIVEEEGLLGVASTTDVKEITILHTNDIHGHGTDPAADGGNSIINYAIYKTVIDEYRAAGNTLVLDAGDVLHGTNFATLSEGKSMIDIMNLIGVDAMTPGNHDFNYGYDRLVELNGLSSFPILAANITKDSDGSHPFASNTLIPIDGVMVGVFGLATPETKTKSNPLNTAGLTFNDVVATARSQVASLEAQGADVIVFLSHLGTDLSSPVRTQTVLDQVSGIDVVIDGHSHSKYDTGYLYNGTLIASTGDWLHNIGETTITLTDGEVTGVSAKLIPYANVASKTPNSAVLTLIQDIKSLNDDIELQVIGQTGSVLNGERADVRTKETNLGNLITDAMLDESGADVVLTNGGGIRASIAAGEITKGDVLQVLPFGNQMTVIEVTGQDILDAVTFGVADYPNQAGKFPHVAGMSYTIMTAVNREGKTVVTGVKDFLVGGEPLDLAKTYTLATNDFMAVGGDGYNMFGGKTQVSLHGMLADITAAYITKLSQTGLFVYETDDRVTVEAGPYVETITVLHTNDIHAHGTDPATDDNNGIITYARYKTIIDEYRAKGSTLVLDAGDVLHGTNFASISNGSSMLEVLNLLGLDAMTPGNHDFNYGYEHLLELGADANFPILAANISKEDGTKPFETRVIFDIDGVKVGVFGLATPETKTKSNPKNTEGLTFEDEVATVEAEIAALKADGAEVIVFLSHLGTDLSSPIRTQTVLDQVTGIDLVIDGHSHSLYEHGYVYNGTLIASTGDWLHNIGKVTITLTDGVLSDINAELIPYATASQAAEDPDMKALLDTKIAENAEMLKRVVGATTQDLDGDRANVRTKGTNLGNLITDAMLQESGADVVITNGGGIRASIPTGNITYGAVLEVLPFGNQMTVIEVSGQDILDALTFGASDYPNAAGKFPHVAGMTFTIVTQEVKSANDAGEEVTVTKFKEITDVMVGSEKLDLTKTYKLATNDFMAVGGDGYTMFGGKTQISLHGMLLDIVVDYMEDLSANGSFAYTYDGRVQVVAAAEVSEPTEPTTPTAPSEPTEPSEPTTPTEPSETTSTTSTQKPGTTPTTTAKDNVPSTGESQAPVVIGFVLVGLGLALAIVSRRKKMND